MIGEFCTLFSPGRGQQTSSRDAHAASSTINFVNDIVTSYRENWSHVFSLYSPFTPGSSPGRLRSHTEAHSVVFYVLIWLLQLWLFMMTNKKLSWLKHRIFIFGYISTKLGVKVCILSFNSCAKFHTKIFTHCCNIDNSRRGLGLLFMRTLYLCNY